MKKTTNINAVIKEIKRVPGYAERSGEADRRVKG